MMCFVFMETTAQSTGWANNPESGETNESGNEVAIDEEGNVYVIGTYAHNLRFRTSHGTINIDVLSDTDAFVVKYDAATGEALWVIAIKANSDVSGNGIFYYDGHIYVCGDFGEGYLYFYQYFPGTATTTFTTRLSHFRTTKDYYIAKIALDGEIGGEDVVCSNFTHSVSAADITANSHYGIFISGMSNASSEGDIYVSRHSMLDLSFSEDFTLFGDDLDYATGIALSGLGYLYVSGNCNSSSITEGALSTSIIMDRSSTIPNAFLMKILVYRERTGFTIGWIQPFESEDENTGNAVAVDGFGNAYVTGAFSGESIKFNSSLSDSYDLTLENSCTICSDDYRTSDLFVVKYNHYGSPVWCMNAYGETDDTNDSWNFDDEGMDIAVQSNGKCFVTGYFKSFYLDFGFHDESLVNTTNNNFADVFVVEFDAYRTPVWYYCPTKYRTTGGGLEVVHESYNDDYGYGIATMDGTDCFAVTGKFSSISLYLGEHEVENSGSSYWPDETYDAFIYSNCEECEPSVDECPCRETKVTTWYFGDEAGLDFTPGALSPVALSGSQIKEPSEGCSVIHDELGNLLFYTDGDTVWDQTHSIISNGTGLLGHESSTQSALIVPQPCHDSRYYIFTTDCWNTPGNGLNYSVVEGDLISGFEVISSEKNINLIPGSFATEKVTYVPNSDPDLIWIVSHEFGSNKFISYPLTEDGLGTSPPGIIESEAGFEHGSSSIFNKRKAGCLKASPDGLYLALAIFEVEEDVIGYEIFKFDNAAGEVTWYDNIDESLSSDRCYSVEFSSNSEYLYFSDFYNIWQYQIYSPDSDPEIIFTRTGSDPIGAMQLAPDGKIYVARDGSDIIDVIQNPDMPAEFIVYDEGIDVSGTCSLGLPAAYSKKCTDARFRVSRHTVSEGEYVEFFDVSSGEVLEREWSFPGGIPETSNEAEPVVQYPQAGVYPVSLTITNAYGTDEAYRENYIYVEETGSSEFIFVGGEINIFPNSGEGVFTITTPYNSMTLEIYDLLGKKLVKLDNIGRQQQVDLSSLAKGVYFVYPIKDDGVALKAKKLIIR